MPQIFLSFDSEKIGIYWNTNHFKLFWALQIHEKNIPKKFELMGIN